MENKGADMFTSKELAEIVNRIVPDVVARTPYPEINWRSIATTVGMEVGAEVANACLQPSS